MSDPNALQAYMARVAEERRTIHSFGPLSARATNVLLNAGVKTPTEAASKLSREECFRLPNCGKKTIKEIEAWLSGFGLHLRGDDEAKAAALLQSLGYTVISPKGMQEADRKRSRK
jgi:DNA-directed RNA polymerase alpha subunit